MAKRYVNKKHLSWVHSLDCAIGTFFRYREMMSPNSTLSMQSPCNAGVQAHHLLKPKFSERGMGRKAGDKDIMPLCFSCHSNLHKRGNEYKFFEEVTGNAYFGHITVQKVWLSSPYYEKNK